MHTLLKKYHNKENGFTLVELLVVVLIIGILAAIAIPVYLGIQNQAHRAAVKGDVNVAVKQVQVALVEGSTVAAQYGTKNGSDKGSSVQVKASTTTGASTNDFMVVGTETKAGTGAIDYTYQYDSVTGQFTDSDSGVALGGGNQAQTAVAPTITSGKPTATATIGTSYSFTVTASGTPNPSFTATGLPTGLGIQATTGVIQGTPTVTGTFNYTITAQNGTTPNATQTGSIVVSPAPALVTYTFESDSAGMWPSGWSNITGHSSSVSAAQNHTTGGSKSFYLSDASYTSSSNTANGPTLTGLTVGQTYTLTTWYNTSGGAGLRIADSNGNGKVSTTSSTSNSWASMSLTWTYAAGDKVQLWDSSYSNSYFDDITVN